jgi:LacI family transcriptional regulator
MPLKPSMKHVAKVANVSTMTVSLALRSHPSIPEKTRQRIALIAEKIGYRPNPLVSALMADIKSKRSKPSSTVIAFINAHPPDAHWRNLSSLERLRNGLALYAEKLGYSISEFKLGEHGVSEKRLISILQSRGIRGVVFAPFPSSETRLKNDWSGFACVAIGYSLYYPHFHCAVNHQIHSVRQVFEELRTLGYKRIGFAISTTDDKRASHNWMSSFLLEKHNAIESKNDLPLFLTQDWEIQKFITWFRANKPEAIVTTNSELQELLIADGIKAPEDVGIAFLHLFTEMKNCSGIDQNDERIAEAAFDLVIEQLYTNSLGPVKYPKIVLIEGKWVKGKTALALVR